MVISLNRMNVSILKLILFTIVILFGAGVFMYLNNCRTSKIESFVEDNTLEHDPTQCDYYIQQYESNSNSEFRDSYLRCTEHISTVEDHVVSLLSAADLIDEYEMLSQTKSNLQDSNQELRSNLTASNLHYASLSNSNVQLTAQHARLTESNTNLESVSNLLDEMDRYQLRIDSLSSLEAEITEKVCREMGSNCGLQSMETLTKDKLQEVLQNHIDIVPKLSKAYILAVKMWIAYQKAIGLIDESTDSNMESAREAYNDTISLFNQVEKSMYSIVQYFSLYKDNFYYTTHAVAASNSTISLSNIPNSENITITFNSNDNVYSFNANDDVYDKLFETCTSSNTQTSVDDGLSNQYIYTVEAACAKRNYAEIIESISNCEDRNRDRDTCVKEQSSNVQSGLEYIYRSQFSRDQINRDYTDDDFSSVTSGVDQKIVGTFLDKVFNTEKPSGSSGT